MGHFTSCGQSQIKEDQGNAWESYSQCLNLFSYRVALEEEHLLSGGLFG